MNSRIHLACGRAAGFVSAICCSGILLSAPGSVPNIVFPGNPQQGVAASLQLVGPLGGLEQGRRIPAGGRLKHLSQLGNENVRLTELRLWGFQE